MMVARAAEDDTDHSPGQQLLADIRAVLAGEFMASVDLCAQLNMLPESSWLDGGLNPHRLSTRLREYGIKPRHSTDETCRGYYRADFHDAWSRYLANNPSEPSQHHVDQHEHPDTWLNAEPSPDTSEPCPDSSPDTYVSQQNSS